MQRLLSILVLLATVCFGWSGPPPHQQAHVLDATVPQRRVHLSYLLFVPASYATTPETRWPLILYLHGGSLRGDDVERLRIWGLPHKLESEPDFPFIVVSPQCPAGEIWTDAEAVDAVLDRVMRDYRIDPQRIYITGHSMGGRGALYLAYRLPSRFAAVLALGAWSPATAWGGQARSDSALAISRHGRRARAHRRNEGASSGDRGGRRTPSIQHSGGTGSFYSGCL